MRQTVPCFSASCLFISLLLAITLSCISPAQSIGQDVLNDICSKSKDSSFCLKSLNSDPQTATTDLLGLAGISIKLAKTTVDATDKFVKSQVGLVTDLTLKKQYTQCVESYDDANDKIDYANERLKAGDYGGVGVATSACLDDVSDCEDPPQVAVNVAAASTISLSEQNKESYELCQIALIISNRLSGND